MFLKNLKTGQQTVSVASIESTASLRYTYDRMTRPFGQQEIRVKEFVRSWARGVPRAAPPGTLRAA